MMIEIISFKEGIPLAQENSKKKMTTSQLLNLIKKSNDFSEVKEAYNDKTEDPVFCHYLYHLMEKHGVHRRILL